MLESLLISEVKIKVKIDDVRLCSILTTNKAKEIPKNLFPKQ